nr:hypothetical protein L203_01880 [Cryptococcus depauperatus CBS 7841]
MPGASSPNAFVMSVCLQDRGWEGVGEGAVVTDADEGVSVALDGGGWLAGGTVSRGDMRDGVGDRGVGPSGCRLRMRHPAVFYVYGLEQ